jgi:hypothetical protein
MLGKRNPNSFNPVTSQNIDYKANNMATMAASQNGYSGLENKTPLAEGISKLTITSPLIDERPLTVRKSNGTRNGDYNSETSNKNGM